MTRSTPIKVNNVSRFHIRLLLREDCLEPIEPWGVNRIKTVQGRKTSIVLFVRASASRPAALALQRQPGVRSGTLAPGLQDVIPEFRLDHFRNTAGLQTECRFFEGRDGQIP